MEAKEVQNVCRLCPANAREETLLHVFDEHFGKKNLSEIIFLTTGIKISESDIVSKKICRKCYESTQNINNIRQIALQQDQRLKDKCKEYLHDKGIKLPNSCIIIRKSNADTADQVLRESDGNSGSIIDKNFSVESKQNPMKKRSIKGVTHLHPSVINLYRKYPKYKLTKKCLDKDITPVVTLCMGQVESYYKRQKLNMNDFIYNPEKSAHKLTSIIRNVARKKTTVPSKSIAHLKLLRTSHKPPSHIVSIKQTTLGKNLPMYSAIPITSVVEKDPDNSAGTSASSVESQKLTLLLKRSHKNRMDDDDEALMSIDEGLNITDNSDTNSKVSVEQEMEGISSNSDGALNANKPNFIQSLGLTPAMLAAGCSSAPVSFDCTICKSTHPNEAALQKHHSRHRICPYCRLKFRTVEIKNNHIENNCAMVGKPGLIAEDKSTEEGKKKSKESPSVDDGTQDSTIISSDKISNTLNKENVIILTDDEDSQATTDDIMEIDVINNTTNIESELHTIPKISICNNVILDQVQNNLTETVFMKKLLLILKKQNLVESREVQACRVNEEKTFAIQDRTCRFTNFSHNFYSYMVPMRFKHGEFTVSFDQTKNLAITTNQWKDISAIVDERKPLSQTQEVSLVNATYPITLVNSQVPSSDQLSLSSSIQVIAAPTMSILLPNTSSAFLGLNVTHDQNQSMQTTPLLQNYTLSMTPLPIINNSVISVQAASNINTDEVVDEKTSSGSENAGSSSSSVSSDGPSTSTSSRSSSTTRKYAAGSSRNLERSTIRRKRRFTSFKAGARKIRSSRSSKLRVKNIWELK